ncbi:MAG: sirohydrochlorin cobaltochelatase [Verrucomicrobiales bacterium]|jgi:sirohydrochlorin cobaltochelatase
MNAIRTIVHSWLPYPFLKRIEILMTSKNHSALVIVGHGSTLNPDSSDPTYQHADTIRARGVFAEVACAFWKEEPSMREVLHMLDSDEVYIVPNFISEGYFTREVILRELQLDGPVTVRDGKVLRYCDPVGIHPSMTQLLLSRADEVAPDAPRSESTLIVVGHGTTLNDLSTKAIKDQVQLIQQQDDAFAQVIDTYMEEPPLISDWHTLSSQPNVIVVPFFIADGLHSYQDIPVMLGLEKEPTEAASTRAIFRQNPNHLHGKALYYSSAIGTEPLMADVILDQVTAFDQKHGTDSSPQPAPAL